MTPKMMRHTAASNWSPHGSNMTVSRSCACYGHDLKSFLDTLRIFAIIPLLPVFISLLTPDPQRLCDMPKGSQWIG
jgi:hypothetical protein